MVDINEAVKQLDIIVEALDKLKELGFEPIIDNFDIDLSVFRDKLFSHLDGK